MTGNSSDPSPFGNISIELDTESDAPTQLKNILHIDSPSIAAYVAIGIFGVVGNSFAIFVLSGSSSMRKKLVNVLLINQSAIDLTASLLLLTVGYNNNSSVIVTFNGISADLYCRLIGSRYPMWGLFVSSTWNLVFVNLEHYLSVVFPIFHKTAITKWQVIACIVLVWFTGPVLKFFVLIWPSGFRNGVCKTAALWPSKRAAVTGRALNLMIQFLLPLVIMACCYIFMIRVIRTRSVVGTFIEDLAQVQSQDLAQGQIPGHGRGQLENKNTYKSKDILKTLAVVTLIFVACWTLNNVIFLLYIIGSIKSLGFTLYHISVYLVFLNCCLNPIIYSAQYKDFQVEMKKIFCSKRVVNNNIVRPLNSSGRCPATATTRTT